MPRPRIPLKHFEDARWREKRKRIMERDSWRCQAEGDHAGDLNVHHRNYTTSEPWNERDGNLITLCEKHHQAEHDGLGPAAQAVASALKGSNWMVRHRKQLEKCITESVFSAEDFQRLVEEQIKKHGHK